MTTSNDEERAREYRVSTLEHRSNLVNKDFELAASQTGQIFTLSSAGVGLATTLSVATTQGRWCLVAAAVFFMAAIGLSLFALTLGRSEIRERISDLDAKLANPDLALGVAELKNEVGGASAWQKRWTRTRRVNVLGSLTFGLGAFLLLCSRVVETIYAK